MRLRRNLLLLSAGPMLKTEADVTNCFVFLTLSFLGFAVGAVGVGVALGVTSLAAASFLLRRAGMLGVYTLYK